VAKAQTEQSQRELERKNAEPEHTVNADLRDLRSPIVAMLGFSRLLRRHWGAARRWS